MIAPAWATLPDRAAIREIQERWWDSIDTLEFQCDEFPLDEEGRPDRKRGVFRYDFAQASGGRRDYQVRQVRPDGDLIKIENLREDGKRSYMIIPFENFPDGVSKLQISNQKNTHEDYQSGMFSVLWLMMPGGKPLHHYLDNGAVLDDGPNSSVGGSVALKIEHGGVAATCILDPEHDWLPREVHLKSRRPIYWKVDRFVQKAGHWFPAAGTFTGIRPRGETQPSGFEVRNLRINDPLPDRRFAPPSLADGVLIDDLTTNRGRVYTKDKNARRSTFELIKLRERYQAAYTESRSVEHGRSGPIEAQQKSGRFPWAGALAFASIFLLAIGGALWFRRRQSGTG